MIKEAIDTVLSTFFGLKREPVIEIEDEKYLYNDDRKCYEKRMQFEPFTRTVCNVDSFKRVVLEEARRLDLPSGELMTVIFESSGAFFYPQEEERHHQDLWKFQREYSLLWTTVKNLIGRQFPHKELLINLEKIKSHVKNFEDLYLVLSKLKVSKQLNFTSNPVYEAGENNGSYRWSQRIDANGIAQEASCPASISLEGTIVRGSETKYAFELSLTPIIDEEKGRINFLVEMPGFENVLDCVRDDEYGVFCDGVKALNDLLILRDY